LDRESLVVELKVGDSVSIDSGRVVMTLREKSGQRARLHFSAERSVPIEPVRERAALPVDEEVKDVA
jgi:hypothetical protein